MLGINHSPSRTWPPRYELLDGLRGVASLGVLMHHLGVPTIGHYCVMIFFVISGYCITAAAESAVRARLSLAEFMRRRVRRIYPPYLAALVFFVLTRLIRNALHLKPVIWRATPIEWLQNLTLTQWVSDLFHPIIWPADNPSLFVAAFWSLNYEEQFYLIVGLGVMLAAKGRLGLRTVLFFALTAFCLTWDMLRPAGPITGLFIEYWPHFALGVCLFFVLTGSRGAAVRWLFLGATGLLAAVGLWHLFPWREGITGTDARFYIEFAVLAAVSIGLVLLRPFSAAIARSMPWRPVAAIGLISYSLYLIHMFNLNLVAAIVAHSLPAGAPTSLQVVAKMLLHLLLASAFWYLFERPFLNRRPPSVDQRPAVGARLAVGKSRA